MMDVLEHDDFEYRDVYTPTPINGRPLTAEGKSLTNELTATRVEGNLSSFTRIEAGQARADNPSSG